MTSLSLPLCHQNRTKLLPKGSVGVAGDLSRPHCWDPQIQAASSSGYALLITSCFLHSSGAKLCPILCWPRAKLKAWMLCNLQDSSMWTDTPYNFWVFLLSDPPGPFSPVQRNAVCLHNNSKKDGVLLCQFCRWGNWGIERLLCQKSWDSNPSIKCT